MVRYALCDGKIMVRKTKKFGFSVEMSSFFLKFLARVFYILKVTGYLLVDCGMLFFQLVFWCMVSQW